MNIRPAIPADATAIARIYNESIAERIATFETRLRNVHEIELRIRDTDWPMLVAGADAAGVQAWASLSAYRQRDCYAGIAEFSIYVERSARRCGLGRPLLEALVETAVARGCWKLLSRIFIENHASRALCRAAGFREVGIYERHGRLDGHWRDVVIVERLLPAALADGSGHDAHPNEESHVEP